MFLGGVIEVQPKLNYGHYPVVSKEYAKLRKEAQQKRRHETNKLPDKNIMASSNTPHYVIAESPNSKYKNENTSTPYYFTTTPPETTTVTSTTRLVASTRHLPFNYKVLSPENNNNNNNKFSKISFTTTKVNGHYDIPMIRRPIYDPTKLESSTSPPVKNEEDLDRPIFIKPRTETTTEAEVTETVVITYKPFVEPIEITTQVFDSKLENVDRRPVFDPNELETEIKSQNIENKIRRPVFDPNLLSSATNYQKFDNKKTPVYDPSILEEKTKEEIYKIQRPVYDPVSETTTLSYPNYKPKLQTLRVRLPSLDPNKLATTANPTRQKIEVFKPRRPIFNPNFLEITTKYKNRIEPTTTKRPIFEHFKIRLEDYLNPLSTTDEGLTHSSLISRRRFEETTQFTNYEDDEANEISLDGRNNRRIDDQATETNEDNKEKTTLEVTTDVTTQDTTNTVITFDDSTTEDVATTQETTISIEDTTENLLLNNTLLISTSGNSTLGQNTTLNITEIIGNNTECTETTSVNVTSNSDLEERIDEDVTEMSTEETSTFEDTTSTFMPTTTDIDIEAKTELLNMSATVSPYKKMPDELEAILNITKNINKKEEDYEFDYSEPSLPPSLPNLR